MIIHACTVELAPNEVLMLEENGLHLQQAPRADWTAVGRIDLADRLSLARSISTDPGSRALMGSFLRQLRV
ncbi:MAG: hypothetical protein ACK44L_05400 [Burkholderiales bacterium]|jgi:hypothetical protein